MPRFGMHLSLKPLAEQVLVLTGATSGIGLTTARMAARRGARLVLAARNHDALQQLEAELNATSEVVCVTADVSREGDVRRVVAIALERFGRIDTWVNNAGVGIFGRLEDVAIEDQRQVFEVNFWGVVYGSLAALPALKARGGALINIGSGFSDRAAPLQGIYSASKHAVLGFTDALRMELEKEGAPVSVTLIKPASIDSMFTVHARNYLDVQPSLPPPVYAPETVARAILHAAQHPERDLHVGSAARLLAFGAHHLPRLLDLGMTRWMFRLQRTKQPPRPRDQHNLHGPADDLQERGPAPWPVFERSWYTEVMTRPQARATLWLGSAIGLLAWAASRRSRH